jgi:hypothetical protein
MKIIDLFPHIQLSEHSPIKHYYQFLNEAVYDTKTTSLKKKFPESINDIDAQVNWAKSIFKTPGQINWWVNLFGDYLENKLSPKQLGDYQFKSIDNLQNDISHYFGFNYQPILTFVFDNKTVKQILTDLSNLEIQFKQKQEKELPVPIQEGDRKLYPPINGTQWWFVNRAYCPEEGRSGKHCGNVVGKHKPTQRILSLRDLHGNVILTFIYEPDGTLGEMKAKGNQKPSSKYHPQIKQLLLGNELPIKGISGMGYLPEMNFSVFDFNEQDLLEIGKNKKELIYTQLQITPVELLKAPNWVKQNKKCQQIVFDKLPGLRSLIDEHGNVSSNEKSWGSAININESLILYAPDTVEEYYERMRDYITDRPSELLRAPINIRKNFEFLCELVHYEIEVVGYIVPTTPKYHEIMEFAVNENVKALAYIPEELRTESLCSLAVKKNGRALQYVPENLLTKSLCLEAVVNTREALYYVPSSAWTEELFITAIKLHAFALTQVPDEYKTKDVCMAALKSNVKDFYYVPKNIIDEELCLAAVKTHESMLKWVPSDKLNKKICLTAVTYHGGSLIHVPPVLKTKEICLAAVNENGLSLKYVPDNITTEQICLAAVSNEGLALKSVPLGLKTKEICLAAVKQDGYSLYYVPPVLKTKEICLAAIQQNKDAIGYVPDELQHQLFSETN